MRGTMSQVDGGGAANRPVTQYTWDAADRLAGVTLPDGTAAVYTYDADGRRVHQTVDTQETNYLWDEASAYGDVVLETDGNGDPIASYVLGGTELIAQQRDGDTSYYLHDGQGSVRGLADGTGTITDRYDYTAFGEPLAQQGTTENPYRYTGQHLDDLTGLYNLRARYYAPGDGRFLSRDPFEGTLYGARELNRYAYAANSPVNLSDPTGWTSSQYGLISNKTRIATGMVSGAISGMAVSLLFLAIAHLPICGPEVQTWARTMTVSKFLVYVGMAAAFGAVMGGLGGAMMALGPAFASWGMFTIGVGMTLYDVAKNGPELCKHVILPLMLMLGGGCCGGSSAPQPTPQSAPQLAFVGVGANGGATGGGSTGAGTLAQTAVELWLQQLVYASGITAISGGGGGHNDPDEEDNDDGRSIRQEIRDIMKKPHLSEADMARLEELMIKDIQDSGGILVRRETGQPRCNPERPGEPYTVLYTDRSELFHEWLHFDYWRQRGWPAISENIESVWAETNIEAYTWQLEHPEIFQHMAWPEKTILLIQKNLQYQIELLNSGGK